MECSSEYLRVERIWRLSPSERKQIEFATLQHIQRCVTRSQMFQNWAPNYAKGTVTSTAYIMLRADGNNGRNS